MSAGEAMQLSRAGGSRVGRKKLASRVNARPPDFLLFCLMCRAPIRSKCRGLGVATDSHVPLATYFQLLIL
jgi:hypothetical protein